MQVKRAAVIVGRFQPPTIGHYAVIDRVKKYIRDNPKLRLDLVPVVVVVDGKETSKDKRRNPLTAKERVSFMTGSGRADGVRFLTAGSAFEAFEAVRGAGFEPIAVAAGSDRAEQYLGMLDRYFLGPRKAPIKHYEIVVDRALESTNVGGLEDGLDDVLAHVDGDLPPSLVSGSLARRAAVKGERGKFAIITGLRHKPRLADLLFKKVKGGADGSA